MKYRLGISIGASVLILALLSCRPSSSPLSFEHRVAGMLWASAIADALAGPHEGRSTEASQTFLKQGGWIDSFSEYTVWHQHHWNVYERRAPAGTVTDDNRMRLDMVGFMLDHARRSNSPLSREELADAVIQRYRKVRQAFLSIDAEYQAMEPPDSTLREQRKQHFLAMRFAWEIFKTATSVRIPQPPVLSMPYQRVSDDPRYGEYTPAWRLEPVESFAVTENIKSTYHFDSYAKGHVMPLGLIHMLPAAVYFPGDPAAAYRYIVSVDFFDIAEAPQFVGVACALLADLLGGTSWKDISHQLKQSSVATYVETESDSTLVTMDAGLQSALDTAQRYKGDSHANRRERAVAFLLSLHAECAVDEPIMCTVQEMLYGSVALLEFAGEDLPLLIELGVNYGRDNDTIASIAATLGGAEMGAAALPQEWKSAVQSANPQYDFAEFAQQLAVLGTAEIK